MLPMTPSELKLVQSSKNQLSPQVENESNATSSVQHRCRASSGPTDYQYSESGTEMSILHYQVRQTGDGISENTLDFKLTNKESSMATSQQSPIS